MAAEQIPVEVACRVLGVSTSGYYAWRSRSPSARSIRHAWLTDLIVEVHQRSRGTYGALRVHAELRLGRGIVVGHNAIALLMRRAGLAGATGRPKWRHAKPDQIATDLVDRNFARSDPNQLWVTDITEHPTQEGKVYCAVVLDAYSRRVVGWSIDATPTAALVTAWRSRPAPRRLGRSSTPTRGCSSLPGRSPSAPRRPGWCRRWARSGIASITR
jgi:transposase InsO family protein